MDDTTHYAVAWFSKNQWEKLRNISNDSDALEKTYEEWLTHAEHSINQMKSKNILITKMHIDLNELAEWCANNDMPIDGNARSQYAAMKLQEKHEENEKGT